MKVSIKNAFSKKRIIALAIILLVVVIMVFSNPDIWTFFSENDSIKLSFQTGVEYDMVTYGNDMLIVNNEGIYAVDKSGRETWSAVASTTSPYIMVEDEYIMLSDINGKTIRTFQKEKLITQIDTQNEILCAKVNKNGYVAVATDELGYKGMVILYNKNGKELFRWHSGTGYIGDIDISKDNKLIISQLMTDKEKLYSKIIMINPSKSDEPKAICEIDGMVLKLKYRDNGSFVAVSESGLYGFKKSGKQSFKVDFQGRILEKFNIDNERNMVLAFDSGLNSTILESYSQNGKLRGSFDGKTEIWAIDVSGECIVLAKHDGIFRINPRGEVKKEIKANNDVKNISIFSNRDIIMSLGSSSAELIKIK